MKYQVVEWGIDYVLPQFVIEPGGRSVSLPNVLPFSSKFLTLEAPLLSIKLGFAYDGASNVIDTKATEAAALIHDALYFVLRNSDQFDPELMEHLGKLCDYEVKVGDFTKHQEFREYADILYYRIARANGMWWPRARLHYRALRRYGSRSARPVGRRKIKDVMFRG